MSNNTLIKAPLPSYSKFNPSGWSTLFASSLGNLLEWYDFGLFSVFSIYLSQQFFPNDTLYVGILKIFIIYGIGFFCRPLGAILFGHLGDRLGRAVTLRLTILVTSFATLGIAFLPVYNQVGILAPILLTLLRITQGLSLGGEFTGIIIYLTEIAPDKHRALFSSLANSIGNLGFLTASGLAILLPYIFSKTQLYSLSWRIAFAVGGGIGCLIFYWRSFLRETQVFQELKNEHHLLKNPFWASLYQVPRKMCFVVSIVMSAAALYYSCFVYVISFLQTLHMEPKYIFGIQTVCLCIMLLITPLAGFLCDYLGHKKSFLINTFLALLLIVPCFKLIMTGEQSKVSTALILFAILSALQQGMIPVIIVEQFPVSLRYTGVSFSYNMALAIFGGSAPLIASWLVLNTGNLIFPAFYILLLTLLTFCSAFLFLKNNFKSSLKH